MWPETDSSVVDLWGETRSKHTHDTLALEALSGWEPTNCGAGVVRPPDTPVAVIHNIVSTSFVRGSSMPINLQRLSMNLECSSYNRRRFAAITIRISNPRCTALLFTSGKLVITGVRSFYECVLASLFISRIVTSALPGTFHMVMNCEIQNIVAHSEANLKSGQVVDINGMYETHSINCTFQKRKVVLTGGKKVEDIEFGWKTLWSIVKEFIIK